MSDLVNRLRDYHRLDIVDFDLYLEAVGALEANSALIALLRASLLKVEGESEGLRKDAERYRYIRQGTSLTVRVPVKDKEVIYYLGHKSEAAFPEAFESAIDAALANQKEGR